MFTPITVVGKIVHADGAAASGGLRFQLSEPVVGGGWQPAGMLDSATGQFVSPDPVQGVIFDGQLLRPPSGGGPYTPLVLYANDDPTTTPVGTVYVVTEQLTAGGIPPWPLTLSHTAAGGTVNLSAQRPVPA